jgi:hypothetical protein
MITWLLDILRFGMDFMICADSTDGDEEVSRRRFDASGWIGGLAWSRSIRNVRSLRMSSSETSLPSAASSQ